MRKEIPLFITAAVGILLILQYFSPMQEVNDIQKLFNDWFQIIAAFSMILGVLNLIRVNGDKIYKKRRNWGYSVIIVVSLFFMMFVGFSNLSEQHMYDRKVLKSNTPVVTNLATDLLKTNQISVENPDYNPILLALIEGTLQDRTITSLTPKDLKDHTMKDRYRKMLNDLTQKTERIVVSVNNIGRELNSDFEATLKQIQQESFLNQLLLLRTDLDQKLNQIDQKLSLKAGEKSNAVNRIKRQTVALLNNLITIPLFENKTTSNIVYNETIMTIRQFNQFLLKDKTTLSMLQDTLKTEKTYNRFYMSVAPKMALIESNPYKKKILNAILPIYLNHIYNMKALTEVHLSTLISGKIPQVLSKNNYLVDIISEKVKTSYIGFYQENYQTYIKNENQVLATNKHLKSNRVIKQVYNDLLPMILMSRKADQSQKIFDYLKQPLTLRKYKTNAIVLNKIAQLKKGIVTQEGFSDKVAIVVISNLLSSGKYKLNTLETGSVFMEMYRYVYTPLSSTMFALLAFFIASASYRAFRARNKEATLLLIAGFLVMLGQIPVGDVLMEMLHLDGLISISGISQFIMEVPNMAAQRAIMIGISLGVISTSLRLIIGIERSHLGGE